MIKYTLVVEGMQCSMCESHVNDAVRKAFPVKKTPPPGGGTKKPLGTPPPPNTPPWGGW